VVVTGLTANQRAAVGLYEVDIPKLAVVLEVEQDARHLPSDLRNHAGTEINHPSIDSWYVGVGIEHGNSIANKRRIRFPVNRQRSDPICGIVI
jgi:hypothetical protein